MNVVMIGAGYVGLVSGACFAEFGANVICVDKDARRIETLNTGEIPIYEPGLKSLLQRNCEAGRLTFTTDLSASVRQADIVFIAVGTPARRGDGHADLRYVYAAAAEIAHHLEGYTVVVDKSTVPVGTAREVKRIIARENPAADFNVASNPEFLREGSAISDFMRPDRVILGVESERAEAVLRELYRPLNLIEAPVIVTDLESAEITKYAANAFLATKISFINEIANLCEKTGADVHAVAKGMGLDGRIGKKFLHAGPGYGGSCFPKDTEALIQICREANASSRIVEAVVSVNRDQKLRMIDKIEQALDGDVRDKTIAVLGLTFKPETDDMREAPSLTILPALLDRGAGVRAHDPQGLAEARPLLPEAIELCADIDETVAEADAVVLMTEWNQYRGLDLEKLRSQMRGNVFVDLRNVYERGLLEDKGFRYSCVGR
jgi:UDPglucose 6-dehydrogenase